MPSEFSPLYMLMSEIGTFTDCALITDDTDRRYFTGMKSSAGTLAVFSDAAYLIIDSRYIEKARKTVTGCEVILQTKLYDQLNELIAKHDAVKVSVNTSKTTVEQFNALSEKISCELDGSDELAETVRSIRAVKRGEEIEFMIAAQRIAESGFTHMLDCIKPGVSERELQLELDHYMLSNGAEALSFDTIALTGKNTSMPHGVPGSDTVKEGDFVLLDFGAVVNGWHSDMTRTVCVGQPTEEMRKVYDIVLNAQLAGIAAVREGIAASDLDAAARKVISDAGYGEYFGHSLGHGVGMDIHEPPFASPVSKEILAADMVVTVEPGIYLPDKFGVRIEDFVVVREDGCFNMTAAPKELIIL
ncbi:Xaa-Pro aminopeptidase [Ruminococcaceae bacterium FB2012]|nr:Xaa-Pro aminopeptidase [Ruminococcaceae bacterium FB2012]